MRPRSLRRPLSAFALAALGACLDHTAHYSPARDDVAMAAIASTFAEAAPGGFVLSLCEDVAADPNWEPDCQEQHVVRGGGRGLAHDEEIPEFGCGGCPFGVVAYVVGTLEGGSLSQPTTVRGRVRLQSGHDADPYAFPYVLEIGSVDGLGWPMDGTLGGNGVVVLNVTEGADGPAPHSLARVGPASCP